MPSVPLPPTTSPFSPGDVPPPATKRLLEFPSGTQQKGSRRPLRETPTSRPAGRRTPESRQPQATLTIGLDVGSTTVKGVVLDDEGNILFKEYTRHYSEVKERVADLLRNISAGFPSARWRICASGSGAISLAEELAIPFTQEVIASSLSIRTLIPDADVVVELGGEDAKLTFLTGGMDQRMNETCAGGTGAFIDQMAAFLQTDPEGLDAMAQNHETIYPIASRCGVFAKTDVLPLLNEGCSKDDIAASIMQAVVNQTISGLARGRLIQGKVVFLGGPLKFLHSLRDRFLATLRGAKECLLPENAEYFVALGAALFVKDQPPIQRTLPELLSTLASSGVTSRTPTLPPLFESDRDLAAFAERHNPDNFRSVRLEDATGDAWLGFDSGSTTIKATLVDDQGRLLHSFYGPNKGEPLAAALEILKDIYERKHPYLTIRGAAATGYGSGLLKAALDVDIDEVETVAHYTAARFFAPEVSFILDIGGQDIKCMSIRDGYIAKIQLNEACSAGCGSFIENFANSLGMSLPEFVQAAVTAKHPVDLGTRCTVFMNSKVKQVQKEGVDVADIAAGLSYAVVRNACFKVMKIRDTAELGDTIIAQGGAFSNDALLRALELQLERTVLRPPIPGLMGAFGAALIARDRCPADGTSTLLSPEALASFKVKMTTTRCRHCGNACLLTISTFHGRGRFVSGNRCERAFSKKRNTLPNLYAYKYQRLFEPYVPLPEDQARRGTLGIPRTLNTYENFPLWFTLFTTLGFRVILSNPSSKETFFQGYETIPSQTVCYPAKLAHGHMFDLMDRGVKRIFFPCLPNERLEFATQSGTYNCPVVIGYPELLARNIDRLQQTDVTFIHDFLPLDKDALAKRLHAIDFFSGIPMEALEYAVQAGFKELERFKEDMRLAGEQALAGLEQTGDLGIVLAGHPYHVDPEVHHGIADLITSCGLAVLTEDSVAHLMPDPGPLRVEDQWTYHSRLYRAGAFVAAVDNLAILQLVSFGCGLDAITADQIEEIVTRKDRLYSQIKIDEGANLGPARIRIRSLHAAMRERCKRDSATRPDAESISGPPAFTTDMRTTHTVLIPQMSPLHFQFLETVFACEGYNAVQLPTVSREAIDLGLRYVNNDACFPAIVVIGQLLQAIASGQFDKDRVAVMIPQTGGGCRATNYIAFLRKALQDSGLGHVPILSFVANVYGKEAVFPITAKMMRRFIMAGQFGDALMRMVHRIAPYEKTPGETERLLAHWSEKVKKCIASGNLLRYDITMLGMIRAFDRIPLRTEERRPRVGLVGEILLKYHPDANNRAAEIVEKEGGEAVLTDLMDFALYCSYDHVYNYEHLAGSWKGYLSGIISIAAVELTRWPIRLGFSLSRHFTPPIKFRHLRAKTNNLISLGHQTGEGWLLVAEMVKLLESGVNNILCMQPFGCLPNHITGKGLLKELKHRYPNANIIALDYDPGASEVNQINRIKLMMSMAK
ncbi:MAG: acyl-CoA dehydratase activase-related protein [Desulfovibrio sp.]|jgi:predicted CoA-substrate-specific enzyme activase|nr:acyl-CoA dehydratase activase-related protein [Desulfovibrio sp.]